MNQKPKVFLTSNVFSKEQIGSNDKINQKIRDQIKNLWNKLDSISELKVYDGRFPTEQEIENIVFEFKPNIIGCHLSHHISKKVMINKNLIAVSTCTAGFNHINRTKKDDVLITHTPGVLHETVADYTIAIIMANLRNLIDLHSKVWNGLWTSEDRWDLDQELSSVISTKKVGIIGLGEIGSQVVRKLYPWGIKIAYYDHHRKEEFEKLFPKLQFRKNMEEIFRDCDIISLHIPLNNQTRHMIDRHYLKLMKKNSSLINTARGAIINLEDLLNLLEEKEIQINLSFDVFPEEPVDSEILRRFKKIKKEQGSRRFIFLPHNASADADTRGRMNVLFLQDIIKIIESKNLEDLREIHLIPQHEADLKIKNWRILKFWNI